MVGSMQHVCRRIDGGQQDSIRFGMPRSVNVNVDDHTLASAVSNLTIQPSAGVTAAASSNAEDAYEELFEGIENNNSKKDKTKIMARLQQMIFNKSKSKPMSVLDIQDYDKNLPPMKDTFDYVPYDPECIDSSLYYAVMRHCQLHPARCPNLSPEEFVLCLAGRG